MLLVIEAAESSLAYDRTRKARAYAAVGIPEYWIANLAVVRAGPLRRRPRA